MARGEASEAAWPRSLDALRGRSLRPGIILQHPSDNAIIVLAPDETEIQHVRGLVKILDVQTTVEWVKVSVEHGDAGSINETVVEILNAPSQAPKTEGPKFHLFTDPAGDGLWFSGTEKISSGSRSLLPGSTSPASRSRCTCAG